MLIDEQFRRCTSFLFLDIPNPKTRMAERTPVATTFMVGIPIGTHGNATYLVTARHVIEGSRPYGSLFVRLNQPGGGFRDLLAPQQHWISHPSTDVAVCRISSEVPYDILAIPLAMFATRDYVAQQGIGVGDELFFVGMFSLHPGRERNQPLARFGTISLMPHEPIRVKTGPNTEGMIDAYLAEARSWGGHSGSPAFVYFPPDRNLGSITVGGPAPALLGMVQGHYNVDQEVVPVADISESGRVSINAGIAVIIPAEKIVEVLDDPELVAERQRLLRELDSAGATATSDLAPLEKEGH